MLLYPIFYVSSVAAFELQRQNCVLATKTIWPAKLNIFTVSDHLLIPGLDNWKEKKDIFCVDPVHLCLVHIIVVPVSVTCGPLEY